MELFDLDEVQRRVLSFFSFAASTAEALGLEEARAARRGADAQTHTGDSDGGLSLSLSLLPSSAAVARSSGRRLLLFVCSASRGSQRPVVPGLALVELPSSSGGELLVELDLLVVQTQPLYGPQ